MNEIKVFINRNGLLSKYLTDTIDFNKHVHDIDIFINGQVEKIRVRRLFKITRWLELRFWPTRKWSQPSQDDFFALQREPWSNYTFCILFHFSVSMKFHWHLSRGVMIHFFHKRYISWYLMCITIRFIRNFNYSLKSMLVDMGAAMFFFYMRSLTY
jgi:hypothetical protein